MFLELSYFENEDETNFKGLIDLRKVSQFSSNPLQRTSELELSIEAPEKTYFIQVNLHIFFINVISIFLIFGKKKFLVG